MGETIACLVDVSPLLVGHYKHFLEEWNLNTTFVEDMSQITSFVDAIFSTKDNTIEVIDDLTLKSLGSGKTLLNFILINDFDAKLVRTQLPNPKVQSDQEKFARHKIK